MSQFYKIARFPNVCGAVDGTHICVTPRKHEENCYVNRHSRHSLSVCAVAGPRYEFFYVNSRHAGKSHDSRILQRTGLWSAFENGYRPFSGAVILGDSAYPLREWLMTPFRSTSLMTPAMTGYQNAHTRTRGVVEKAFGILKMRFRALFNAGLRFQNMSNAADTILAACIIHNICIKRGDDVSDLLEQFQHVQPMDLPLPPEAPIDVPTQSGNAKRERFVACFQ